MIRECFTRVVPYIPLYKLPAFVFSSGLGVAIHRNNIKRAARKSAHRAEQNGELTRPGVCQMCGRQAKLQRHHVSYNPRRWNQVIYVCEACHNKFHRA
jgi:hypothetical protein